jgi:hypothetical protein
MNRTGQPPHSQASSAGRDRISSNVADIAPPAAARKVSGAAAVRPAPGIRLWMDCRPSHQISVELFDCCHRRHVTTTLNAIRQNRGAVKMRIDHCATGSVRSCYALRELRATSDHFDRGSSHRDQPNVGRSVPQTDLCQLRRAMSIPTLARRITASKCFVHLTIKAYQRVVFSVVRFVDLSHPLRL